MQRQTTEGLRSCGVSWFRVIGLTLGGILLVVASSHAGAIDASWTAPATTTDGNTLTNLAFYRLYYSPSGPPCPGSTFAKVVAATPTSSSNQTVSFQITGLTTGLTYSISVTAVDADGNESACSAVASAVAKADVAALAQGGTGITPTGTVSFGKVTIGSSATRTFTVQSMSSGTSTGTASVPAPFRIDSGSPFTLGGPDAIATVTVRFTPTTTAAASASVIFASNGQTWSRLVTGIGTTTSNASPPLSEETSRRRAAAEAKHPTSKLVPAATPASEPTSQPQERPRSPGAAGERPSHDATDPGAVIDWLLMRGR